MNVGDLFNEEQTRPQKEEGQLQRPGTADEEIKRLFSRWNIDTSHTGDDDIPKPLIPILPIPPTDDEPDDDDPDALTKPIHWPSIGLTGGWPRLPHFEDEPYPLQKIKDPVPANIPTCSEIEEYLKKYGFNVGLCARAASGVKISGKI